MSKVIETTVYTYDELSKEAKQVAVNEHRDINVDHGWWDFVYEDVKTIAALMGIDIDNIFFSGFWSKGDGACFEGSYAYKAGSVAAVKQHAPLDEELHRIVEGLAALQRTWFYQITASFKHQGHYNHRYCTTFYLGGTFNEEAEAELIELIRDLMYWTYRQLESNYEALTTDEAVAETIKANEYDFTEDGEIF